MLSYAVVIKGLRIEEVDVAKTSRNRAAGQEVPRPHRVVLVEVPVLSPAPSGEVVLPLGKKRQLAISRRSLMLRACLFDMGNVLVFFSHDRMCEQIGRLCGLSGTAVRQRLIESGRQWDYERGQLTPAQFHDWFCETTRTNVRVEDLIQASSDIFQLNEPIVPVLERLKQLGLRLILLSNTCQTHFEWVRDHFEVLQRFDGFVTSYQVGAIKPEPDIFRAALDQIGCEPHECFYTDDIANYVQVGREFGLQAEVFVSVPSLIEQLRTLGVNV